MEIISGFIFGIVGSLHCVGMCGPIALALPIGEQSSLGFTVERLVYNFGRVISYSFVGAIIGLLGGKILLPILQQNLSIIIGALIIITVLFPPVVKRVNIFKKIAEPLNQKLTSVIAKLLSRKAIPAILMLGFLNGFLPCGFVYLAISTAAVIGSFFYSLLFMIGFGLGTIPAMLVVSLFPKIISAKIRMRVVKILPAFQVIVGLLLIIRGLNLGIPFLSPEVVRMIPTSHDGCCD